MNTSTIISVINSQVSELAKLCKDKQCTLRQLNDLSGIQWYIQYISKINNTDDFNEIYIALCGKFPYIDVLIQLILVYIAVRECEQEHYSLTCSSKDPSILEITTYLAQCVGEYNYVGARRLLMLIMLIIVFVFLIK